MERPRRRICRVGISSVLSTSQYSGMPARQYNRGRIIVSFSTEVRLTTSSTMSGALKNVSDTTLKSLTEISGMLRAQLDQVTGQARRLTDNVDSRLKELREENTGQQTLVSSNNPTQGMLFNHPDDLGIEPSGNLLASNTGSAGNSYAGGILRINPQTGVQTLVTSFGALTLKRVMLNSNSTATFKLRLARHGRWQLRVVMPAAQAAPGYIAGFSRVLTVRR